MINLSVPDLNCGHCAGVIKKAIAAIDPAADVAVDLTSKTVKVNSEVEGLRISRALSDAGYPNSPA